MIVKTKEGDCPNWALPDVRDKFNQHASIGGTDVGLGTPTFTDTPLATPLSSDAFTGFSARQSDAATHNRNLRVATAQLIHEVVPALALRLFEHTRDHGCFTGEELVVEVHANGVNMRHLGLILAHISALEDTGSQWGVKPVPYVDDHGMSSESSTCDVHAPVDGANVATNDGSHDLGVEALDSAEVYDYASDMYDTIHGSQDVHDNSDELGAAYERNASFDDMYYSPLPLSEVMGMDDTASTAANLVAANVVGDTNVTGLVDSEDSTRNSESSGSLTCNEEADVFVEGSNAASIEESVETHHRRRFTIALNNFLEENCSFKEAETVQAKQLDLHLAPLGSVDSCLKLSHVITVEIISRSLKQLFRHYQRDMMELQKVNLIF